MAQESGTNIGCDGVDLRKVSIGKKKKQDFEGLWLDNDTCNSELWRPVPDLILMLIFSGTPTRITVSGGQPLIMSTNS